MRHAGCDTDKRCIHLSCAGSCLLALTDPTDISILCHNFADFILISSAPWTSQFCGDADIVSVRLHIYYSGGGGDDDDDDNDDDDGDDDGDDGDNNDEDDDDNGDDESCDDVILQSLKGWIFISVDDDADDDGGGGGGSGGGGGGEDDDNDDADYGSVIRWSVFALPGSTGTEHEHSRFEEKC